MGVRKNTITINGRIYDAVTGKPIDGHSKPTMVRPVAPVTHDNARKIAVTEVRSTTQHGSRDQHNPAHANRKPERAKTLMRSSVKRPVKTVHTSSVAGLISQPEHIVMNRGGSKKIEQHKTYAKSSQISKFGHPGISRRTADLPVVPAPNHHSVQKQYDISSTPPAPRLTNKSTPLKELHRDLFETAIQSADSHKAKRHRRPRQTSRSIIRLGASALTVTLLFAFYATQNIPNIALKRASGKIGFNAHIPNYKPAGFALSGPVQYQPGRVTLSFRSNSDTRAYTVTQIASGIDNNSLASRFLAGKNYETVSIKNYSGYIYDGSSMTWARNGVWYAVEGNAFLSKDQLIHIASSL